MKRRILCVLLCAMMLSSACVGCSHDELPTETEAVKQTEVTLPQETLPAETEKVRDSADLPDKTLDGYTFRILSKQEWNPATPSSILVVAEEETGELLNDTIYKRNLHLMETYDFEFSIAYNGSTAAVIQNSIRGNLDEYDLAAHDVSHGSREALTGIYMDLHDVPYVSLEKSYWDQNMQRDLSIRGKYYQVCGDIFFTDEDAIMVTLYNKPLADDYGLENLYSVAREGKWTVDKMQECISKVISDLNGDGVYGDQDVTGLMYANNSVLLPYFAAADVRLVVKDETDTPVLNDDLEELERVYSTMQQMYQSSGYCLDWLSQTANTVPALVSLVNNKQILFQNMITSFLRRNYRDVEADFGILPMPKFSEEQDVYSSSYNIEAMQGGFVPITIKDIDTVGFILEAMADASGELTDAYNEVCLSSKYTRDKESYEMIKLAKENIVLDLAFIYDFGGMGMRLSGAIRKGMPFVSTHATGSKAAETAIEKFLAEQK